MSVVKNSTEDSRKIYFSELKDKVVFAIAPGLLRYRPQVTSLDPLVASCTALDLPASFAIRILPQDELASRY